MHALDTTQLDVIGATNGHSGDVGRDRGAIPKKQLPARGSARIYSDSTEHDTRKLSGESPYKLQSSTYEDKYTSYGALFAAVSSATSSGSTRYNYNIGNQYDNQNNVKFYYREESDTRQSRYWRDRLNTRMLSSVLHRG